MHRSILRRPINVVAIAVIPHVTMYTCLHRRHTWRHNTPRKNNGMPAGWMINQNSKNLTFANFYFDRWSRCVTHVSQYLKLILFFPVWFHREFIFGKRLFLIHCSNRYGDINGLYITQYYLPRWSHIFIWPNYVIMMIMDHALSRSASGYNVLWYITSVW